MVKNTNKYLLQAIFKGVLRGATDRSWLFSPQTGQLWVKIKELQSPVEILKSLKILWFKYWDISGI
jgi:hypothetical protein